MASDPETMELLEPLRAFLETFTEELAREKFIPAFREEIAQLRQAFETLSQSQETLEQISHGVDRLRNVFAPAGTRLLGDVKDLEQLLSQNIEQLHSYTDEALDSLRQTHGELENSLRSEAEQVQESTKIGREALVRTTEDIEQHLAKLRSTVQSEPGGEPLSAEERHAVLQEFYEATKREFEEKSQHLQTNLQENLAALTKQSEERLEHLSEVLREITRNIGPKVREEVEAALEPLGDHLRAVAEQIVKPSEKKKGGAKAQDTAEPSAEGLVPVKTLTQKLVEFQRRHREGLTEFQRAITEAIEHLSKETAQREKKSQESLATLAASLGHLAELSDEMRKDAEKSSVAVESLKEVIREQKNELTADQLDFLKKIEPQISQSREAVVGIAERLQSENAAFSQRIEEGFKEVQGNLSAGLETERSEIEALFNRFSTEWKEEWVSNFGEVTEALSKLDETLQDHLGKFSTAWTDQSQAEQERVEAQKVEFQRISDALKQIYAIQEASPNILKEAIDHSYTETREELSTELRRISDDLKQIHSTQEASPDVLKEAINHSYTETREELNSELRRISDDLKQIHSTQDASPKFLTEAVRHSYTETQKKLGQIIDAGYDKFLQQVSTVPQNLERYAKLLESLHNSDELALNAIATDCKSVLKLAGDEFSELKNSYEAQKKIFPLLERKLERQLSEIGSMQRGAENLEEALQSARKELRETRTSLSEIVQTHSSQTAELTERTVKRFSDIASSLDKAHADIKNLRESVLATIQRELTDFVTNKFEFLERALGDYQTGLKTELTAQFVHDRRARRKGPVWIFALIGFGIILQLMIYFFSQSPVSP